MESIRHQQIYDALLSAHHPVFISDERTDGDSLGSALAMVDFLWQQNRSRPPVFVSSAIPEIYQYLPHIDMCTQDRAIFQDATIDLIVVFDCSDNIFVDGLLSLIPAHPRVINIDHHKTNALYGKINQVIVDAPATAEVVYRFFEYHKLVLSKEAATCLLTGLCFDTTAFSNSATNERVFTMASQLILSGARVQDAIRSLFQHRSVAALRVWGLALERLHDNPDLRCVVTCLTRKDIDEHQIADEEIAGLSNFLSLVTDTDTLAVLRETADGGVKVSMRSSSKDVSAIAKTHGGGGHEKAAGYTIAQARLVCRDGKVWKVEKNVQSV